MAYNGFISYSHAADGRLAPALQRGLQRLAKPWNSRSALRIFRDETGLSTNPHLWSAIEQALDESTWFVLLASPESAQSPWVGKEVSHWLATKSVERILPVLTDGTWEWDAGSGDFTPASSAVPDALRGALREEPRHLDLAWARDETDLDLRNSRFRSAVADLAAPMHGVAKDELEGEDIRQHRRARRLARGGVATLALLLVVSLVTTVFALGQRDDADHQTTLVQRSSNEALARGLTAEVATLSAQHRNDVATLLATEAAHYGGLAGSDPSTATQAHEALLGTVAGAPWTYGYLSGVSGTVGLIRFSPNGRIVVSSSSTGQLRAWRLPSLHAFDHQPPPYSVSDLADLAVNDSGLVARAGFSVHSDDYANVGLWDLTTGKPWRWQPPSPKKPSAFGDQAVDTSSVALSNGGLLAVVRSEYVTPGSSVGPDARTTTLDEWNVLTGRQVFAPVSIPGTQASVAISPDARTVAVSVTRGGGNTSLVTQLVDASNGSLGPLLDAHPKGQFDPYSSPGLRATVFSADSRHVSSVVDSVSEATPDDVATFDVATGAPVWASNAGETADSYALAVSADLRVLVLSSSSGVSVVDSATGADLADIPFTDAITQTTPPLAVDPAKPIVAFQAGEGAITLADWAQVGARHVATFAHSGRLVGPVVLSPVGAPVGLARPLRLLGLPPQSSPQDPWMATVSNTGAVAIISSSGIAIWDPVTGRITRRLTGISIYCNSGESLVPDEWAFTGSAATGHVVASCGNTIELWALSTARSAPTWQRVWPGRFVTDSGVQISDDGAVVTDGTTLGIEIRDGRTGRVRAAGPTASEDNAVAATLSADGHVLATDLYSGTVILTDTTNGSVLQTLAPQGAATFGDNGGPGTIAQPMLAISPDHRLVASWHLGANGVQLWDATTGQSIAVFDGRRIAETSPEDAAAPGDQVGALTFTRDGSGLVLRDAQNFTLASAGGVQTGASYGVMRTVTWSLRPSNLVQAACATVMRNLTPAEWDSYVGASVPYHHTCARTRSTG